MRRSKYDICIIGAGAAGLAAAARLNTSPTDESGSFCILEKNDMPGRKVLATGGGRCNITNSACPGAADTLGFFSALGLECREDEEGRFFPCTGRASDVVAVLEEAAFAKPAGDQAPELLTGFNVGTIHVTDDGFEIIGLWTGEEDAEATTIHARKVLLACGGKAGPQYGTIGDGFRMATALGHSVTRVYPILTGVECLTGPGPMGHPVDNLDFEKLKGIRTAAVASLLKDGEPVCDDAGKPLREAGEVQFTEHGLSGICIFNLTPYMKTEDGEDVKEGIARYSISLDLAPDFTAEQLKGRNSTFGIITKDLADAVDAVAEEAGCGPEILKDFRLQVTGIRGWKEAQCTAGGVDLSEINLETMESRIVPGLYMAGEILDIQGPCGGYNLQNAWETGIRAAEHMK